jgi:hypothetical protein
MRTQGLQDMLRTHAVTVGPPHPLAIGELPWLPALTKQGERACDGKHAEAARQTARTCSSQPPRLLLNQQVLPPCGCCYDAAYELGGDELLIHSMAGSTALGHGGQDGWVGAVDDVRVCGVWVDTIMPAGQGIAYSASAVHGNMWLTTECQAAFTSLLPSLAWLFLLFFANSLLQQH